VSRLDSILKNMLPVWVDISDVILWQKYEKANEGRKNIPYERGHSERYKVNNSVSFNCEGFSLLIFKMKDWQN
jgi:hypothetical protein